MKQIRKTPVINQPMMQGFQRFNRFFLRKHFHTVAANSESIQKSAISSDDSLVLYANHASWWDPLVALYMADRLFGSFKMYAPIDAEAFEKYRMFGRMGFFPVQRDSLQGAKAFLQTSREILLLRGTSLWVTPEGRFADVRDGSADLMPGLAHLAKQLGREHPQQPAPEERPGNIWFIPAAVEYVFWEERLPEVLIWIGEPMPACGTEEVDKTRSEKADWQSRLTAGLRRAQAELATHSIARNASTFEVLLRSKSGTFFVYDWWRKFHSRLRLRSINTDHSELLRERSE